ncbi:MAG: glycosyltransferase, partial [Candidatus Sericytochromatia bacterium]|nr:glycosyltransferase [Candidatus Tanganyikabacteria bacterium]
MLLQDAPGVRFVLAGPDVSPDNAELTARVQERGLANSVHLLGDRRDTPEVNAALDIASSSSAWGEGFANVIGEAMSCAVPCVVTDVGDSAWIVGDTGMLVSPRHPAELAMAWQRMIALGRDGQTSMGARARQRVIDYFSLGVVATQYAELYQQVVARSER